MSEHKIERIAVLGAGGMMGFAIARNLCRAGFEVRAWNRSREKAEPLSEDGAVVCDSPAEAVDGADVALTMLADADVVMSVMSDALGVSGGSGGSGGSCGSGGSGGPDGAPVGGPGGTRGADQKQSDNESHYQLRHHREGTPVCGEGTPVWVQMSTIGEDGTWRCQQLAEARGVSFVDSPVLGSKEPAAERKLVILASGPERLSERLQPLYDAIGQRTMWLGEAGGGSRLKLAINAWIGAVVEGGAEVLALAEALGCDPNNVLEALSGGPLDLPYLRMKAKKMLEHDFDPSFTLELAAKDMRLASEAAEQRHLDLPLLSSVRARFEQSAEKHGAEDMSAAYLTLKEEAGAAA